MLAGLVRVFLDEAEFEKFMEGKACKGAFTAVGDAADYYEVLVERERVTPELNTGFFGPRYHAQISGSDAE